jgi:transposase-like protein
MVDITCPHCGSSDTEETITYSTKLKDFLDYSTYHCKNCGYNFAEGKILI